MHILTGGTQETDPLSGRGDQLDRHRGFVVHCEVLGETYAFTVDIVPIVDAPRHEELGRNAYESAKVRHKSIILAPSLIAAVR